MPIIKFGFIQILRLKSLGVLREKPLIELLSRTKSRVLLKLGTIDEGDINVITPLCLKNVDVKILIPRDLQLTFLHNIPSCASIRLYEKSTYRGEIYIVDDNAYIRERGSKELKNVHVEKATRLFQSLWSNATAHYEIRIKPREFNLRTYISFIKWYLAIKLEPFFSYTCMLSREFFIKIIVKLMRAIRGRWYPFTLLEPELQRVLKEKGFKEPTLIQFLTIPKILSGSNVLAIAPTGSGKTESVILPVLNFLLKEKKFGKSVKGVSVLYISPMKALASNVTKRIREYAHKLFGAFPEPVMEWHSDIKKEIRKRICNNPPLILVTTPESLEAILDLWCERILQNVKYIIVDEVHELIGSKRGEQVLILMERIKSIRSSSVQRLFISATLPKPHLVARLLSGSDEKVIVIEDPSSKKFRVDVCLAQDDERNLAVLLNKAVGAARGYIIFTNSRGLAEILKYQLEINNISDIGVYHSSLSREVRRDLEKKFEEDVLRGLIATRALELGIDISSVDKVAIVGSPGLPEYVIQRFGRGSHKPHLSSAGIAVAIDEEDLLEILALLSLADRKKLVGKTFDYPSLDVIARELVADALRASRRSQCVDYGEVAKVLVNSYPTRSEYVAKNLPLLVSHLIEKGILSLKIKDNCLTLGSMFSKLWPKHYIGNFFSFIPPRREAKVIMGDGRELGSIDATNLLFLKKGYVIRLGGDLWRIVDMRGLNVIVNKAESEVFSIPIWRSGEIPTPQIVAIEAYRLLKRTRVSQIHVKRLKFRNIELNYKLDESKSIKDLKGKYLVPSPRLMIVDVLLPRVLEHVNFKIRKHLKVSHKVGATALLYPFGSHVVNTITAALWREISTNKVLYIYPRPLGILLVHIIDFNAINWLLGLNRRLVEESIAISPYVRLVGYEIARSLGYLKISLKNLKGEDILYNEAVRQALSRFYDIDTTLKLVDWVRKGCITVVKRNVIEPEGMHVLARMLFRNVFRLGQ